MNGTATSVGGFVVSGANLDPNGSYNLAPLQNSAKLLQGWNRSGGQGEIDLISNRSGGVNGGFAFYDYANNGTLNSLVSFQGNGNVGIGTMWPGVKLDVAGMVAGIYSTKPGVVGRRQTTDPKASTTEVPMAIIGVVPPRSALRMGGSILVTYLSPPRLQDMP